MPQADDVELGSFASQVACGLAHDDKGCFFLSDDKMVSFIVEATAISSPSQRKQSATDLVALAIKWERTATEPTRTAVSQVALLVALLLDGWQQAQQALTQAGSFEKADLTTGLGQLASKIPVGARAKVAGALTPHAARALNASKVKTTTTTARKRPS